jgi:D-alanyl-D-alanine carboxypeptidase
MIMLRGSAAASPNATSRDGSGALRSTDLALATAMLVVAGTSSGQGVQLDDLDTRIERHVEPYVATSNFSGVVLVARNGRPVTRQAYGYADDELSVPARPDTKSHIASASKSFTAAALLLLEQQGRLGVNDGVGRFVSGYPNGDRLTLRHLLVHRSGIPNVDDFPDYDERSRFPQALAEIVSWFRDRPLAVTGLSWRFGRTYRAERQR